MTSIFQSTFERKAPFQRTIREHKSVDTDSDIFQYSYIMPYASQRYSADAIISNRAVTGERAIDGFSRTLNGQAPGRESHSRISDPVLCIVFSALVSFVCLLSTGCLADGLGVNRNTNESAVAKADLPSGGHLIEVDLYESADNYCESLINETSPKLGLAPLPQAARSGVVEFRIWTNLGGLSDPKLLRVHSITSGNSGSIFDLTREIGTLELRKKEPLSAPHSGWNNMLFEVRRRLTTPKGLVRDPNFSLQRDEPLIVLEVLDKGDYRRVLYGQGTTFPDGKRLIEVCNYLASEFKIALDCPSTE